MSEERGEYRGIRRVLLDGPDFQALSGPARRTFVWLKLNLGPSGIEARWYGLVPTLAAQLADEPETVAAALDELEEAGWIERQSHIVWIVGQLEHEPSLRVSDRKHRKSIQAHVLSLPRLDIVVRFQRRYADWFDGPAETPSRPSEGSTETLPQSPASTEDRRPKTEDREPKTENRRPKEGLPPSKGFNSKPPPLGKRVEVTDRIVAALGSWPSCLSAYQTLRASMRQPTRRAALDSALEAIQQGMPGHGPGFPWDAVGVGLHDLVVAGGNPTPNAIRGFVAKAHERLKDERVKQAQAEDRERKAAERRRRRDETDPEPVGDISGRLTEYLTPKKGAA